MKTTKIIYWVTTSIICLFALGAIQMNSEMAREGANHVLIPRYLALEISIGQLIGLVLLIVPAVPKRFKEWAYVGFGIMYISALNAHIAVGDPFVPYGLMAVIFFGLLLASYISFHKLQDAKK
ncbi:MAG: DoxX family protein [Bacteroidota bacterium]|jgi:DoxX-like family|nr:DoxX family protein [Bacteroidota bacterium]